MGRLQLLAVSGEGARVLDDDSLDGLITTSSGVLLDLLDDVHALEHLTEDDVTAIEPRGHDGGDEELNSMNQKQNTI